MTPIGWIILGCITILTLWTLWKSRDDLSIEGIFDPFLGR